jgi:hypothetical protein
MIDFAGEEPHESDFRDSEDAAVANGGNSMKLRGRVMNGRVEVDGELQLPDGTLVEVTIAGEESFDLSEEDEEELWRRHQEIEQGDFVSAEEVLKTIRSGRRRG